MRDFDSLARKKKEGKLYDLLSEMISTERIYVADLEEVQLFFDLKRNISDVSMKVCRDYLPLVEENTLEADTEVSYPTIPE